MAEQLDAIESTVDRVVGRSIQNEQDVRWLMWGVRGAMLAAISSLLTLVVASITG